MTKFLTIVFLTATLSALADGPVVQTTPYTRGVLQSQNSSQAQTALGFTGNDTSSTTMLSVSNWANGAMLNNPLFGAYSTNAGNSSLLGGIASTGYVTNDFTLFPAVPVCTNLSILNKTISPRANALSFLSVMNVLNNPIGRGFGQKKVLFLGDSMSDPGYSYYSTALFMDYFLRTTYGNNGNGLNSFDQSGTPALSRPVGQSLFPNNEVGVSEVGDNPPLEMSQNSGGSQNTVLVGWSMNATNPINYEAVWYMQWPFGGNFTVTNYNSSGINTVGLALNSYSASTTNLVYASLPIGVSGIGNSLHFVSTSGTNVICGAELSSTNTPGIESYSYAWDGHGQLDQLELSSASFTTLSNSINPDWIIFHEKNNDSLSDAAYTSNTIALVSQFTNAATKVVLVGTPDMVGGSYASQRGDLQYAASLMGWYYIDVSQDFNNANLMSSNGYFADGVEHPSAIGAEQWAVDLMMRMQQLSHDQTNYGAVNLPNLNNNINGNNENVKSLWMYNSGNDSRDGLLIGGNVNAPSTVATANTEKFGSISGLTYASSYSGGGFPSALALLGYDSVNGYTLGYIGGAPGYTSPDYWDITVSGTLTWQIQGGGIADQGTHFITAGGVITAKNGFASIATGSVTATSTGITNTLPVILRVWMATGQGVELTNFNTGFHSHFGAENSCSYYPLQSGEALWGNSIIWVTNIAQ